MPFFELKQPIEAYRCPKPLEQPSDGLIFFLRTCNLDGMSAETVATLSLVADSWIIRVPALDNRVFVLSDDVFRALFKPL